MEKLRQRLTYANVTSTLCLFLLVGGGTALATNQLAKNSVGPKQLKKGSVTTAKLKNRAVKRSKIDLASLGTVPSATDAQTLRGMDPAQISAAAKLACPAGTTNVSNLCFETQRRDGAKWEAAAMTCANAGRLLPSPGQLAAYDLATNNNFGEWTDSVTASGDPKALQMSLTKEGAIYAPTDISSAVPFRCVVAPGN